MAYQIFRDLIPKDAAYNINDIFLNVYVSCQENKGISQSRDDKK